MVGPSLKNRLSTFFREPAAAGLDLDSPEATFLHARMLRRKSFLRRLYGRYYDEFVRAARVAPDGARVELGSGAGFLADRIPGLVRVDVRSGAEVEVVASALALPFTGGSVGAVFLLNVLHHLPDVEAFFGEVEHALAPGGRVVLIEPYVSPVSRLVYRLGHHEPFDPEQSGWSLPEKGAMTTANDALAWIVFCRDRRRFETSFPRLEVLSVRPHTISLYVLSGGFSFRSFLPGPLFPFVAAAEDLAGVIPGARALASMMTVELRKRPARTRPGTTAEAS